MALRGAIVTSAIALMLGGAPAAYATESSVDAYAGEAAVLGKPGHKPHRPGTGGTGARETNTHGTTTGQSTGSSTGTGASSGGGSTAGAGGTGTSDGSGGGNGATSATGGGGSSGTAGGKTPSGPARGIPSIYPAASAGGSSLSMLDIVLIVAGALMLAAIAMLLHRGARTTS